MQKVREQCQNLIEDIYNTYNNKSQCLDIISLDIECKPLKLNKEIT